MKFSRLTPQEAWEKIEYYKSRVYDGMAALYSGNHDQLHLTSRSGAFWNRRSVKCRIHVPLAADIAGTSANLLFSSEPTYTVSLDGKEEESGPAQKRLEEILARNSIGNKLNEAAETCAALGDVYMKIRWNRNAPYPLLDVVQPDQAWPEYLFGELRCVHFFTDIARDPEKDQVIRAYECYEPGRIIMKLYEGTSSVLGEEREESDLESLGYQAEIKVPAEELLAVHIANIRPNRQYRSSMLGRSDYDGLRDLFEALDEAMTSWMRDIRLAKARLIVPAEYLRRRPARMEEGLASQGKWEFDADVETYVAMDINTDTAGIGITPSQFSIRAQEHLMTCTELVRYILQTAGYSPNTFGFNVEGLASGTALSIRERKSAGTKNKKLTYWQAPLDRILTAMVRLDHALYPDAGSSPMASVNVSFADSMGADVSTLAATVQMLTQAGAISNLVKVRMIHPDWAEDQVQEEVQRLNDDVMQSLMLAQLSKTGQPTAAPEEGKKEKEGENVKRT